MIRGGEVKKGKKKKKQKARHKGEQDRELARPERRIRSKNLSVLLQTTAERGLHGGR